MKRTIIVCVSATILCCLSVNPLCGVEVLGNDKVAAEPISYWPKPNAAKFHYESRKRRNGEIEWRARMTITYEGKKTFNNLTVQQQRMVLTFLGDDSIGRDSEQTVYYMVNDTILYSLGFQFPQGPPEIEEWPYIDLQAPLTQGSTWKFRSSTVPADQDAGPLVDWDFESEVAEVGITLEVPAGIYTNCIRVIETGISRNPIRLVQGDYSGQLVTLKYVVERWWCQEMGCIKERDRHWTMSTKIPNEVLTEIQYEADLTAVEMQSEISDN